MKIDLDMGEITFLGMLLGFGYENIDVFASRAELYMRQMNKAHLLPKDVKVHYKEMFMKLNTKFMIAATK